MMDAKLPILYSFRRCPYAMRARLAIRASGVVVELREVVLREKPAEMLAVSAKGTVPVLVMPEGAVIDESLDIMLWALGRSDPQLWLTPASGTLAEMVGLIAACDADFKGHLDGYKYAAREAVGERLAARDAAGRFLDRLEARLGRDRFLFGPRAALGDIAIFPFVRQFAFVDKTWFDKAPWRRTGRWLDGFLGDPAFTAVMAKIPQWRPGQPPVIFGAASDSPR